MFNKNITGILCFDCNSKSSQHRTMAPCELGWDKKVEKMLTTLLLKLPRHAESSYTIDARRKIDNTASVEGGLIYS